MKKVVGYVVSVAGLVVMALGFNIINFKIALLDGISANIIAGVSIANVIAGVGIAMIVVGVILSLKSSGGRKSKQAKEEVPIYEGVGKKRKIVGYRKD